MKICSFLICASIILVGCGRKENPIPEKKDSFPKSYPKQDQAPFFEHYDTGRLEQKRVVVACYKDSNCDDKKNDFVYNEKTVAKEVMDSPYIYNTIDYPIADKTSVSQSLLNSQVSVQTENGYKPPNTSPRPITSIMHPNSLRQRSVMHGGLNSNA
ncbi:MAG: hypothetical protein Q8S21_02170 [Candidatus Paracaedibacteraceae bacterium]|nr:hypothetical protein [Candidatus Paracaedibacteraceae bacterium]